MAKSVLSLQPSYYEALKRLTLELAGVQLGHDHAFLIETRLSALAREQGFESLQALVEDVFGHGQPRLAVQVVSALLERDTHFFSDKESFNTLGATVLPNLTELYKGDKVRILSFGCSSGQELVSAMITAERFKQEHQNIELEYVGVDYPSNALSRAISGEYTHFEVQRGLPVQNMLTHFERVNESWKLTRESHEKLTYESMHLLQKIDGLGHFHVVMFLNRLTHYSAPAQIHILRELASIVCPLGYLMLGHKTKDLQLNYGFDAVKEHKGFYRRRIKDTNFTHLKD